MIYWSYRFYSPPSSQEALVALLGELPFESFVEEEDSLLAYLRGGDLVAEVDEAIKDLPKGLFTTVEKEEIQPTNWNEVWESNFHPVVVDDFCAIRAPFHMPIDNVRFELVIEPKMAFGTGHHQTTFMMLQLMRETTFTDKTVLDFGGGTGVLAIIAAKKGATTVTAIDHEYPAYESARENADQNGTPLVVSLHGTLEQLADQKYDIILANINRNVILDTLPTLSAMVHQGGNLFISGFLDQDRAVMEPAVQNHGFTIEKVVQKDHWIAMQLSKI